MSSNEFISFRKRYVARERAILGVMYQLRAQILYLRDRSMEHHQRLHALDGLSPEVPPFPTLVIPPELYSSLIDPPAIP